METFSALLGICAGIHRSSVNSPHRGQWHGPLVFSLICAWINDWVNNREAGDLRLYPSHYDVTVMTIDKPVCIIDWLMCILCVCIEKLSLLWITRSFVTKHIWSKMSYKCVGFAHFMLYTVAKETADRRRSGGRCPSAILEWSIRSTNERYSVDIKNVFSPINHCVFVSKIVSA